MAQESNSDQQDKPTSSSAGYINALSRFLEYIIGDGYTSNDNGNTNEASGIAIQPTPRKLAGCPVMYEAGIKYTEGDEVSNGSFIFQCKPWPQSQHCSQMGFAPEVNSVTEYWKQAWVLTGTCSGTKAPSSSPNFVLLPNLGRCPDRYGSGTGSSLTDSSSWSSGSHVKYREGDTVAVYGIVFSCKPWPFSSHCAQQGYEPMTNSATPDAWKIAWKIKGYCEGSNSPSKCDYIQCICIYPHIFFISHSY